MNPLADSKTRMFASGFTIAAQTATSVAATAAGSSASSALLIGSVVLSSLSGLAGNSLVTDFHEHLPRPVPDPGGRRWNNDILRASALAISDILHKCSGNWNAPTEASVKTLANTVATFYDKVENHDPLAVVTETEVRQSMEKGDAFRHETAGSPALWTAFLHHVIRTSSTLPAIAQPILDNLGAAIARSFNNQLFQVLKFDFASENSPVEGHAYAAITLKLLMQSAATQRETLQKISEIRQEQRAQNAALLTQLSAGLASGISQTVASANRSAGGTNVEREELYHFTAMLGGCVRELRASRESLGFLHALPTEIATLIDRSLDQIQGCLIDLQRGQIYVEQEVRSSRKKIFSVLTVTFVLLAFVGFEVWRVASDTSKVKQQGQQVVAGQQKADNQVVRLAAQLSEVQKGIYELQQRYDPKTDPISNWSQKRLEAALAEQLKIKVEDLRVILVAGSTSLDALVAGQALLALGRQEEAEKKFDQVIRNESASLQRLWRAYLGKALLAYDGSRFEDALVYYRKSSLLIDKDSEPVYWAMTKMGEVCTLYELHHEAEMIHEMSEVTVFSLSQNYPGSKDSPEWREKIAVSEGIVRRAIGLAMKVEISPSFWMRDILEPQSDLVTRLTKGADPLSRFLWNRFSPAEQQILTSPNSSSDAIRATLAQSLNHIMNSGSIYSDELFQGVQLRQENRILLNHKPQKAEEVVFNRRLLEDAYPQALRKKFYPDPRVADENVATVFGMYISLCRNLLISDDEIHRRLELEREKSGWSVEMFDVTWRKAWNGPYWVTVAEVLPEGQGPVLGIREGDIVRRYNDMDITTMQEVVKLTGESNGAAIPMEIQRGDEIIKLNAKPGRLGLRLKNVPQR